MAAPSCLPFVYISGAEVKQLVGMGEIIEEMSRGLQWVSAGPEGGVVQPVRSLVQVEKYSGYIIIYIGCRCIYLCRLFIAVTLPQCLHTLADQTVLEQR